MGIAVLAVGAAILASIWAVSGLFLLWTVRTEARLVSKAMDALRALIEPPAEGQPSPLGVYTDQLALIFAARVVQQLKTAAAGVASGVSKEAEADALGMVAGGSPWVALLAGLLPKRFRRSLLANPQFTGQLGLFGQGGGGNHHAETASVADRLRRQA